MTALKIDFSAYAGMSLQSEYMRSLPVCSFVQFATIFLQKNPRAKSRLSLKSALMNTKSPTILMRSERNFWTILLDIYILTGN